MTHHAGAPEWEVIADRTAPSKEAHFARWYVMLAVLALAVAESLLGNRHLSVDKEAA
jgi:hypothetical protein